MTPEILYQDFILRHFKNPQNYGILESPTIEAVQENPVCGDEITLQVKIENNLISDIKFQGKGCAISIASASMMTEQVKGLDLKNVQSLIESFRELLLAKKPDDRNLGDLERFAAVKKFPIRIKCALLAWLALEDCLPTD